MLLNILFKQNDNYELHFTRMECNFSKVFMYENSTCKRKAINRNVQTMSLETTFKKNTSTAMVNAPDHSCAEKNVI